MAKNIQAAFAGMFHLFLGIILLWVSWYVWPPLLNHINDTVIKTILWMGFIVVWVVAMLIVPIITIHKALTS